MILSSKPVFQVQERNREGRPHLMAQKLIDTKVREIVLGRIGQAKGGLFPSTAAPEVIIGLLTEFESGKGEIRLKEKKKSKHRIAPFHRRIPIGLMPVDLEGWLNSLMQFVLYVPGFAERFSFAPRSWYPIQDFIDQYHHDQQENRLISSANGLGLYRFLIMKLPNHSLQEICRYFFRILHSNWQIHTFIHEALKHGDSDLFVTEIYLKKQIFCGPNLCYDLDAFIEMRPDGAHVSYVAYVKIDGSWFQCDDERITHFRSDSLSLPLQRGVLAHYRRISLETVGRYYL
jgi:hypothetical protein